MASVGIRCGGSDSLLQRPPIANRDRIARPCCSLRVANSARITMSMRQTVAPEPITRRSDLTIKHEPEDRKSDAVVLEKLVDGWMKHSVGEIVKNLHEAPLLVHVYSEDDDEKNKATLKTEKALEEESWGRIIEEWKRGSARKPEGVIFVEQLKDADEEEETSTDGVTMAWGVVVQGRGGGGVECGPPTCYLLKTSRAGAGPGMGLCCTHYCLVKVKSFRETTSSQLKNCWLAQGN
ncbi:hypothetical protein HS088_TW01G00541 [Tripterygium wilfordii]|uniref:DUF7804 domain-containing protein n=1 Tax=Tripterygium wilfordii TaxID=458696 RepID=A0A7J7E2U0_TRIWF|nr:uncharacterized protein LOC119997438 [Tripterygium wilfordii]KAF5752626.1 hypothetical protein HS088_TW01G00541 [Tripterygium wilfordii]